jgi:hypothetical protein
VELTTLTFVLLMFLNVNACVSYCRNAGNPYLNEKNKKYVRKYKTVIVVWNFAFIMKIFMSLFGVTISKINDETKDSEDFLYSLETFVLILFTEIIPFYLVLDKKIIKIFSLKFLEINVEENGSHHSGSERPSNDNSIDMDDERAEDNDNPYLPSEPRERLLSGAKKSSLEPER